MTDDTKVSSVVDKALGIGYQQGVLECLKVIMESRKCFDNKEGIDSITTFLEGKLNKEEVTQ
tara:strand:+ start:1917 stop:2102 length:186 start_codon:yes stop_codon:yes gene_type:complete